jgi:Icc-related predicted phosphoesterase
VRVPYRLEDTNLIRRSGVRVPPGVPTNMRIVCISDTHGGGYGDGTRVKIPEGDVLVHAGDLTSKGTVPQIVSELDWIASLDFKHRLVIAGNHDFLFENDNHLARALIPKGVTYLQDSGVRIDGIEFWGSPWQPTFHGWAFNLDRGIDIAEQWALIPKGTDVLITHGPPHGILDIVPDGEHVGCVDLLERIREIRPKLCVFGHIHASHGMIVKEGITFVNAATCDEEYLQTNPPIVVDL